MAAPTAPEVGLSLLGEKEALAAARADKRAGRNAQVYKAGKRGKRTPAKLRGVTIHKHFSLLNELFLPFLVNLQSFRNSDGEKHNLWRAIEEKGVDPNVFVRSFILARFPEFRQAAEILPMYTLFATTKEHAQHIVPIFKSALEAWIVDERDAETRGLKGKAMSDFQAERHAAFSRTFVEEIMKKGIEPPPLNQEILEEDKVDGLMLRIFCPEVKVCMERIVTKMRAYEPITLALGALETCIREDLDNPTTATTKK
jgi:hypothetical protein